MEQHVKLLDGRSKELFDKYHRYPYISSSQLSAWIGISPWMSHIGVMREYHLSKDPNWKPTEPSDMTKSILQAGKDAEQVFFNEHCTGAILEPMLVMDNMFVTTPDALFIRGCKLNKSDELQRIIANDFEKDETLMRIHVEVKNPVRASYDTLPTHYMPQIIMQLHLLNTKFGYFVVNYTDCMFITRVFSNPVIAEDMMRYVTTRMKTPIGRAPNGLGTMWRSRVRDSVICKIIK